MGPLWAINCNLESETSVRSGRRRASQGAEHRRGSRARCLKRNGVKIFGSQSVEVSDFGQSFLGFTNADCSTQILIGNISPRSALEGPLKDLRSLGFSKRGRQKFLGDTVS